MPGTGDWGRISWSVEEVEIGFWSDSELLDSLAFVVGRLHILAYR